MARPIVHGLLRENLVLFVPLAVIVLRGFDPVSALLGVEPRSAEHRPGRLDAILDAELRSDRENDPVVPGDIQHGLGAAEPLARQIVWPDVPAVRVPLRVDQAQVLGELLVAIDVEIDEADLFADALDAPDGRTVPDADIPCRLDRVSG